MVWRGYEVSEDIFLLCLCCLLLVEETAVFGPYLRLGGISDTPLRILFMFCVLLLWLWIFLLLCLLAYFPQFPPQLLGGALGCLSWRGLYQGWYRMGPSWCCPGRPGQGLLSIKAKCNDIEEKNWKWDKEFKKLSKSHHHFLQDAHSELSRTHATHTWPSKPNHQAIPWKPPLLILNALAEASFTPLFSSRNCLTCSGWRHYIEQRSCIQEQTEETPQHVTEFYPLWKWHSELNSYQWFNTSCCRSEIGSECEFKLPVSP